ncbi:sulfatase-like hydrolase/transferase [Desulforhopalus singaporensis]|uniref:Arylsulfatase A n=1 Tax=Desulforhopalus singaporensis TaxID=91360 RepID=A0A1H0VP64_9BACT|nr:sulfatase-like hydrolase/transferase [Desulforhopalus singaporensis]SDP79866.1 Arylsulfatase A [Desulforhopalus singaporensis]
MANQQPNILFIVTDHTAYFGHDREGEFEYKLPRFEKFASQGVRFSRAYSISPVCTPARSSMMTGQYSHTHGLTINTEYGGGTDFRQGQQLYSHYLSQAGYRNGYIGKWHCGHHRLPVDYGIEGWSMPDYGKVYQSDKYKEYCDRNGFGSPLARIDYNRQHPEWRGQTLNLDKPSPFNYFMRGCGVLEGPPEAHEEQFVAKLVIEKLREFANSGQPWSMVASFWGPHHPYFPSEPYASMVAPESIPEYPTYRNNLESKPLRYLLHRDMTFENPDVWPDWSIWQTVLARAYGQGYQTDAAVGEILDAVEDLGLMEDTIVIWCSDHGDTVASHGGVWDKAATFSEEVGRIPMAVRWPSQFPAGRVSDRLVSNMDVTATMLEAAGLEVPTSMHSRSMLPLCIDPKNTAWPEYLICEHHGHTMDKIVQRIIIQGKYKYVAALYEGDELYDLEADPFETKNLIDSADHKIVKAQLRERIIEHIEKTDDVQGAKIAYALKQGR